MFKKFLTMTCFCLSSIVLSGFSQTISSNMVNLYVQGADYADILFKFNCSMSVNYPAYMDISFPNGISSITVLNSYNWEKVDILYPPTPLWNASGVQAPAQYPLVSAHSSYYTGLKDYSLKIRVYFSVCGTVPVQHRATIDYGGASKVVYPTSGAKDQQGFFVKSFTMQTMGALALDYFRINSSSSNQTIQVSAGGSTSLNISYSTSMCDAGNIYLYKNNSQIKQSTSNTGSFTDAVTAGVYNYYLKVNPAVFCMSTSAVTSNTIKITVEEPVPPPPPPIPPAVTSSSVSYNNNTVTISWGGNSTTTGYEICGGDLSLPVSTMATSHSFTGTPGSSGTFRIIPVASNGTKGAQKDVSWNLPAQDAFKLDISNTTAIPYNQLTTIGTGYLRTDGVLQFDNGSTYYLDDNFANTWLPAHGVTSTDNVIMAINYTDKRPQGFLVEFEKASLNVAYANMNWEGNAYSVGSGTGTVVWLLAGSCLNYVGCVMGSTDESYYDASTGQFMTYRQAYCQTSSTWQNAGFCALDVATFVVVPLKVGKIAIFAKFSDAAKVTKTVSIVDKSPLYKALSAMTLKVAAVIDKMDPDMIKIFTDPKTNRIKSKYADDLLEWLEKQKVADPANYDQYASEVNSHLMLITDERQVFKPYIVAEQGKATNIKIWGEFADGSTPLNDVILSPNNVAFKKSSLTIGGPAGKQPFQEIDHIVYKTDQTGTTVFGNFVTRGPLDDAHNLAQARAFKEAAPSVFGSGNKYKMVGWWGMDKADVIIAGIPKKAAVDSTAFVKDYSLDYPTKTVQPSQGIFKTPPQVKWYTISGKLIMNPKGIPSGIYIQRVQNVGNVKNIVTDKKYR